MNIKSYTSTSNLNINTLNSNINSVSGNQIHNYVDNNMPNYTPNKVESVDLDIGNAAKTGLDLGLSLIGSAVSAKRLLKWKVTAGCYDVIEGIGDGLLNLGSVVEEKKSIIVSKILSKFNENLSESYLNNTTKIRDFIRDDISINYVDGIEQEIYEHTNIGSNLNHNSFIKYDSPLAEFVEEKSKQITELVGAAYIPGGPVTGRLVAGTAGFFEHYGMQGEQNYQKSFDLTKSEEIGMITSGAAGALDWIFKQELSGEVLNFVDSLGIQTLANALGSSGNPFKAIYTLIKTRRHRTFERYVKGMAKSVFSPLGIADIGGGILDDVSYSLNNNEKINGGSVVKNAGWNVLKNAIFGAIDVFSGSLRTPSSHSIDHKIESIISTGARTWDAMDDASMISIIPLMGRTWDALNSSEEEQNIRKFVSNMINSKKERN